MYLEVVVGDQRPVTYRLSRPVIAVGPLLSNGIVVSEPSISKQHIQIIFKDDHWYACDHGVEVPLEEGKDLSLGDDVLLRLVEKPDTARVMGLPEVSEGKVFYDSVPLEKTDLLSLEEFKAAGARAVEKKRKKLYDEAHPSTFRTHGSLIKKRVIALLLIAGCAFVLNYTWRSSGNLARDEFIKLPKGEPLWRGPAEQSFPSR